MSTTTEITPSAESIANAPVISSEATNDKLCIAFGYDGNLSHNSGVSNFVLTVGDYLSERGHDVHHFVARTELHASNIHALARTVNIPSNGSVYPQALPAARASVEAEIDAVQPDVFHSQLPFQPWVTGHAIKRLGSTVARIGTFHTLAETPVSKMYTRLLARMNHAQLAEFDMTFAATPPLQDQVSDYYGIRPSLLALPVNVEKLSVSKKMSAYDDEKLNLAFIGRLDPRKGCQNLLGAMSLLDAGIKNSTRLLIAGDGPLRSEMETTVNEHNLEESVHFLGTIPPEAKPDFLATSDIAVFPAIKSESFGLVIAEALAATSGVVVGGNNPGYQAALGYQREALFDPTSPAAIAEFIKNLVTNDALRDQIRNRQRCLVADYDIRNIGPTIENAYLQAAHERQRA
jgi:phosphatidylinositol alpha-mannosyltransferase